MTEPAAPTTVILPADLATFAEGAVGRCTVVADLSWPYEGSEVYRIRDEHGIDHVLKRLISDTFYAREATGYSWSKALAPLRAPQIEAADPGLRAVIATFLPGVLLKHAQLDPYAEFEAYRQVGELLRALHDSAKPTADTRVIDRLIARTDTHLLRAGDELNDTHRARVHRAARQLARLSSALPAVPTHGDFWPRNLLIDSDSNRVAVIDFERAALAPAVCDMVRLETGVFSKSAAVRNAFYIGYGRTLTSVETAALRAWIILDAVSALAWALAHDDAHLLEHARLVLRRGSIDSAGDL